jgi:4-hydroxybenzoate polyprenyltransferase
MVLALPRKHSFKGGKFMKFRNVYFSRGMIIALVLIGILQFFQFPKYLDYVLLVIAIVLGTTYIYKKFKKQT